MSVHAGQPWDQVVPLGSVTAQLSHKGFFQQVTIYRQLKWQSREQNPELNPILHTTKLKLLLGGISVLVAYLFTAIQGSSQGCVYSRSQFKYLNNEQRRGSCLQLDLEPTEQPD